MRERLRYIGCMSDYWFDDEAIASERLDADIDMASLEAAGRSCARGRKIMQTLRARGDLAGAARACSHGSGYPLKSLAAENTRDPRAGEVGFRCSDCLSVLTGSYPRYSILFACEKEWSR